MSHVPSFLLDNAEVAAPRLLGWSLVTEVGEVPTTVVLTEVEAYGSEDPASHAFRGRRVANRAMFGRAGTLYVYRSYGLHWCANVVCGPEGVGAAILLRAGVPSVGIEEMARRRGRRDHLTSGPGKLTAALGIDASHNRLDLFAPGSPIRLVKGVGPKKVTVGPRVGISKAVDLPWRFRID